LALALTLGATQSKESISCYKTNGGHSPPFVFAKGVLSYGNRILLSEQMSQKGFIPASTQAHRFNAVLAIAGAI
jgi:hypothetical protein